MFWVRGISQDSPVGIRVLGWSLGSYSWHHDGTDRVFRDGVCMCMVSHGSEAMGSVSPPLACALQR